MDEAGVPEREDVRAYQTKMEIALREIDRVRAAGVVFGMVLADAGYGMSAEFRRALSDRGLTWAVGISRIQKVYPADVELHMPRTKPGGRPRKHPVPSRGRESAEDVLTKKRWRSVTWRTGTKGPLTARFAATRVVVADGVADALNHHLPGEEAWLVGELRSSGERKYYLTNHPSRTSLHTLAAAIKARWSCEQAHQQMKEELGLDHFEGRSWTGLHHHALMTMISFAFLQHLRLTEVRGRGENQRVSQRHSQPPSRPHSQPRTQTHSSPRTAATAHTPSDSAPATQKTTHATRSLTTTRRATLPEMPRADELPAARVDLR